MSEIWKFLLCPFILILLLGVLVKDTALLLWIPPTSLQFKT